MTGIDKTGKNTGPGDGGYLVTDADLPQEAVYEIILSNYNIDGNLLKTEHKTVLVQHVIPFVKANDVHVEITGFTSRTGAASYNRQLSLERAERVRQFLLRSGLTSVKVPASDMKGVGEDRSTSKLEEDALERAVVLRIVVGVRKAPAAPRIVVPKVVLPKARSNPDPIQTLPETVIVVDTHVPWAIMELSGFNLGPSVGINAVLSAGVQAGTIEYHFLLVNLRTRQMAQCRYFGGFIGGTFGPTTSLKPQLGPSFGISMTQSSNTWNSFSTPAGTTFESFAGAAGWNEPGSLGFGSSISIPARLNFLGIGIVVNVSTGHTIGTPGSLVSAGNFHLKPPLQLQL
jgi:OmpA family